MPFRVSAYLTTGLNERITWSLPGIPDSEIFYVSRFSQGDTRVDYFYAAPLRPGHVQDVAAAITPTNCFYYESYPDPNLCLESAGLTIMIPSFGVFSTAVSGWSVTNWGDGPGEMSLLHGDFFTHDNASQMIRIYFTGTWLPSPTNEFRFGHVKQFNIYVFPIDDLYGYEGVDDAPWLKGFPDMSVFEPAVGKSPKGCGLCSRQGLPVFRVNTAALNPVIGDTDYAHESPGPDIRLARTYNADSSVTGLFGKSWSFSYESWVDSHSWGVVVRRGSGRELQFSLDTNTTVYTSPAGVSDRLSWTPSVPDRPGYGAFQYYESGTRLIYQYETPWAGGPGHPPLTNGVLLSFISDLNSNRVSLAYTNGRVRLIQDAVGRTVVLQHSASGYCTNILTSSGHTLSYGYNATGNLIRSQDAIGNVTDFTYDGSNSLSSMSTEGRQWQFRYQDGLPSLLAATVDPLGYTNTYALTMPKLSNRLVTVKDARGNTWRYYSKGGATWREMDPLLNSNTTTFANGFPVSIANARGFITTQEFDSHGNLVRRVRPDGATTTYAYDTNDWLVAITNALGGVTRFEYDARGNLTRHTLPSGRETVMSYDSRGLMLTRRDGASNTVSWTYDAMGNPVVFSNELGHATRYTYDAAGIRLVSVTNARGFGTQFAWDGNGRPLRVTHPDGTYREREYGCCAESARRDELGRRISMERDLLLQPLRQVDARGSTNQFEYDPKGNRVRIVNGLGRQRSFGYDENNRLVGVTNAAGHEEVWRFYDPNGNVSMMRLDTINFSLAYDSNDRLQRLFDGLYACGYAYDALGRLTACTNGRGQSVIREYDADGRVTRVTQNGATFARFEHNGAGAVVLMVDAWGTNRFEVDRRQAVTNIVYPDGHTAGFAYDAAGNVAAIRYPGGVVVNYEYDSRDRITNMTWGSQWMRFGYDAVGNLLYEQRSGGVTSRYEYDAGNYITNLTHGAGTTVLVRMRYDRDRLEQVTNAVKLAGVLPVAPAFSNSVRGFSYLRPGYEEDWNGSTLTFDPDGNRTNITGAAAESAAYDAENRLAILARGAVIVTNVYDGWGRRVQSAYAGAVRRAHYDHSGRLLFETDRQGGVVALYAYRMGDLVALRNSSGIAHFHLFDALGSTMALVDQNGAISAIYRYLPYGEVASRFERVENRFTFVGRFGVQDDGDGLFHMANRVYDARTGRFLQRDPVALLTGGNLYAYASDNPVNRIDPGGLEDEGYDAPVPPDDCQVAEGTKAGENDDWPEDEDDDLPPEGDELVDESMDSTTPEGARKFAVTRYQGRVLGVTDKNETVPLQVGRLPKNVVRLVVDEDSSARVRFPNGKVFPIAPGSVLFLDPNQDTMENACFATSGIR